MTTVVLGAGAVGTATAWYLRKSGHDVVLVERQGQAAMETSWGNGGVIHASEVEPWSQPGMPMKIIKWLGKENAPLLLRYGAIPHMLGWGIEFARKVMEGKVDVVILMTGVGTRFLVQGVESRYPKTPFLKALSKTVLIARVSWSASATELTVARDGIVPPR